MFTKDELLLIEYALKQLRGQTNKDIINAVTYGVDKTRFETAMNDIDNVLLHVNNELDNKVGS